MKKWEISCDGWYPYCPVCRQETFYRTPVCMNCGELLEQDDDDMEELKIKDRDLYEKVMECYWMSVRRKKGSSS